MDGLYVTCHFQCLTQHAYKSLQLKGFKGKLTRRDRMPLSLHFYSDPVSEGIFNGRRNL